MHLDCEYYAAATACYGIGDYHRPYYSAIVQKTLQHECECADCHHQECGKCNAVRVAGAYCGYCLGQIAQYHSCACDITAYDLAWRWPDIRPITK